jgi:hypothetical protein
VRALPARAPAALPSLPLATCSATVESGSDLLVELAACMTGTCSSRAQHLAAPDEYFEIRLVMVPIRPRRTVGPWLYVEQAVADEAGRARLRA